MFKNKSTVSITRKKIESQLEKMIKNDCHEKIRKSYNKKLKIFGEIFTNFRGSISKKCQRMTFTATVGSANGRAHFQQKIFRRKFLFVVKN